MVLAGDNKNGWRTSYSKIISRIIQETMISKQYE